MLLDQVIEAIEKAANTGKIGDGKIFVFELEQVVRIRTGKPASTLCKAICPESDKEFVMKKFLSLMALCGAIFGGAGWPTMPRRQRHRLLPRPNRRRCCSVAGPVAAPAPAVAEVPRPQRLLRPQHPHRRSIRATTLSDDFRRVLVILMSIPGLALFYGGLVRSKNMLSVLMRVFTVFSLISVLWVVYGYSVTFTEGNAFFGSFSR